MNIRKGVLENWYKEDEARKLGKYWDRLMKGVSREKRKIEEKYRKKSIRGLRKRGWNDENKENIEKDREIMIKRGQWKETSDRRLEDEYRRKKYQKVRK